MQGAASVLQLQPVFGTTAAVGHAARAATQLVLVSSLAARHAVATLFSAAVHGHASLAALHSVLVVSLIVSQVSSLLCIAVVHAAAVCWKVR